MKILYFSKDYTTHDHRFLTALAGRGGDEIFYLRLNSGGRQFEDRALPGNVTVLHWDSDKRTPRALKRILKAVQPDVVHAGPVARGGVVGGEGRICAFGEHELGL